MAYFSLKSLFDLSLTLSRPGEGTLSLSTCLSSLPEDGEGYYRNLLP